MILSNEEIQVIHALDRVSQFEETGLEVVMQFEEISATTGIPLQRLGIVLDHLIAKGLIRDWGCVVE